MILLVYFAQTTVVRLDTLTDQAVRLLEDSRGGRMFYYDLLSYGMMELSTIFPGLTICGHTPVDQWLKQSKHLQRQINPGLKVDGVLLTLADMRTNLARATADSLKQNYGRIIKVYQTVIPVAAKAAETSAAGQGMYSYDKNGAAAKAYQECRFPQPLIGGLLITVLSFIMIMSVYGRFFRLYRYTTIAPVPLSAFAGEPSQNVGKSFLKSYSAVCLEEAIIVLACIIFSLFAASPPVVDPDAAAVTMVWSYVGELIFNMLVLVGAVKMADRVVREMMGL